MKEVKELSIEEPKIKEEIVIDENFSDDQLNSDIEEELNNDEVIVDNFSVTARQKIKILSDSLEDTFEKDENGVCISSEHYWINTYDDDYVYLNRYSWSANGNLEDLVRAKYSIDEANMVASIDKTSFEVVFYQPITKEEKELLEDAKKVSELRMEELEKENLSLKESNEAFVKNEESLNIKVEEFVSTLAEKDVTIENLESFKLEVEKQISEMEAETFKAEADELIEEYTKDLNDVEEFEELKTKCYEMELTEIEDYCLKLVGKLNHKKVTKPKKQTKFNKSIVGLVADSKEEEKVLDDESLIKYGEYSQYLQKK